MGESTLTTWMRGNLTKDPLYHHQGSRTTCILTLATDLPDGTTDFWTITATGTHADYLKAHQAQKGDFLVIHGRLDHDTGHNEWRVKADLICMNTSLTHNRDPHE